MSRRNDKQKLEDGIVRADKEFILNADDWPGALLPLIKRQPDGQKTYGFIYPDVPSVVHEGNVFDEQDVDKSINGTSITHHYNSVDLMLDDGWSVD